MEQIEYLDEYKEVVMPHDQSVLSEDQVSQDFVENDQKNSLNATKLQNYTNVIEETYKRPIRIVLLQAPTAVNLANSSSMLQSKNTNNLSINHKRNTTATNSNMNEKEKNSDHDYQNGSNSSDHSFHQNTGNGVKLLGCKSLKLSGHINSKNIALQLPYERHDNSNGNFVSYFKNDGPSQYKLLQNQNSPVLKLIENYFIFSELAVNSGFEACRKSSCYKMYSFENNSIFKIFAKSKKGNEQKYVRYDTHKGLNKILATKTSLVNIQTLKSSNYNYYKNLMRDWKNHQKTGKIIKNLIDNYGNDKVFLETKKNQLHSKNRKILNKRIYKPNTSAMPDISKNIISTYKKRPVPKILLSNLQSLKSFVSNYPKLTVSDGKGKVFGCQKSNKDLIIAKNTSLEAKLSCPLVSSRNIESLNTRKFKRKINKNSTSYRNKQIEAISVGLKRSKDSFYKFQSKLNRNIVFGIKYLDNRVSSKLKSNMYSKTYNKLLYSPRELKMILPQSVLKKQSFQHNSSLIEHNIYSSTESDSKNRNNLKFPSNQKGSKKHPVDKINSNSKNLLKDHRVTNKNFRNNFFYLESKKKLKTKVKNTDVKTRKLLNLKNYIIQTENDTKYVTMKTSKSLLNNKCDLQIKNENKRNNYRLEISNSGENINQSIKNFSENCCDFVQHNEAKSTIKLFQMKNRKLKQQLDSSHKSKRMLKDTENLHNNMRKTCTQDKSILQNKRTHFQNIKCDCEKFQANKRVKITKTNKFKSKNSLSHNKNETADWHATKFFRKNKRIFIRTIYLSTKNFKSKTLRKRNLRKSDILKIVRLKLSNIIKISTKEYQRIKLRKQNAVTKCCKLFLKDDSTSLVDEELLRKYRIRNCRVVLQNVMPKFQNSTGSSKIDYMTANNCENNTLISINNMIEGVNMNASDEKSKNSEQRGLYTVARKCPEFFIFDNTQFITEFDSKNEKPLKSVFEIDKSNNNENKINSIVSLGVTRFKEFSSFGNSLITSKRFFKNDINSSRFLKMPANLYTCLHEFLYFNNIKNIVLNGKFYNNFLLARGIQKLKLNRILYLKTAKRQEILALRKPLRNVLSDIISEVQNQQNAITITEIKEGEEGTELEKGLKIIDLKTSSVELNKKSCITPKYPLKAIASSCHLDNRLQPNAQILPISKPKIFIASPENINFSNNSEKSTYSGGNNLDFSIENWFQNDNLSMNSNSIAETTMFAILAQSQQSSNSEKQTTDENHRLSKGIQHFFKTNSNYTFNMESNTIPNTRAKQSIRSFLNRSAVDVFKVPSHIIVQTKFLLRQDHKSKSNTFLRSLSKNIKSNETISEFVKNIVNILEERLYGTKILPNIEKNKFIQIKSKTGGLINTESTEYPTEFLVKMLLFLQSYFTNNSSTKHSINKLDNSKRNSIATYQFVKKRKNDKPPTPNSSNKIKVSVHPNTNSALQCKSSNNQICNLQTKMMPSKINNSNKIVAAKNISPYPKLSSSVAKQPKELSPIKTAFVQQLRLFKRQPTFCKINSTVKNDKFINTNNRKSEAKITIRTLTNEPESILPDKQLINSLQNKIKKENEY